MMNHPELTYRPEIDGLRAVAVLLVVIYHMELGFFTGGFIGVDVFFVISGFLITGILMVDLNKGQFSFTGFYERRCRRILPALSVMCLLAAVAGFFFLLPIAYREFGASLVATSTYWANHFFFQAAGYFDTESFKKPLLHTWSLAVEEQFYIVVPFLLWALHRKGGKLLLWVFAGMAAISLICSQVFLSWTPWRKEAESAFYLLPSRFWEMLIGSILAIAPRGNIGTVASNIMSWIGLGLIAASATAYNHETPFPGFAALPPCLGTALFILSANGPRTSLPVRWLSYSAPVGIGKISYSLYLYHWPLLAMPRCFTGAPLPMLVKIGLVAAAFALARLSLLFVENPIRRRTFIKSRRAVFAISIVSIVSLASIGSWIRRTNGFPGRLPEKAKVFSMGISDRYSAPPWIPYTHTAKRNEVAYHFRAWDVNPGRPASFIVLGNSHARMWLEAVDILAAKHDVSGIVVDPSNARKTDMLLAAFAPPSGRWNSDDMFLSMLDFAHERNARNVLLILRYSPSTGLPVLASRSEPPNEWSLEYAAGLSRVAAACRERGLVLWFAENVPEHVGNMPDALTRNAIRGGEPENLGYSAEYWLNRNSPLSTLFPVLEAEGVNILRMESVFFPNGRCSPGDAGGSYYLDDNHLTRYGARQHKDALAPFFEAMRSD